MTGSRKFRSRKFRPTPPDGHPAMPTDVAPGLPFFDRIAGAVARFTSRAIFFSLCALLVLLWAPSIVLIRDLDTWQLVINTTTTIVTFLLVALLQNTQTRADNATQHKLNAISAALADLMEAAARNHPDLVEDRRELLAAVGLEEREEA